MFLLCGFVMMVCPVPGTNTGSYDFSVRKHKPLGFVRLLPEF